MRCWIEASALRTKRTCLILWYFSSLFAAIYTNSVHYHISLYYGHSIEWKKLPSWSISPTRWTRHSVITNHTKQNYRSKKETGCGAENGRGGGAQNKPNSCSLNDLELGWRYAQGTSVIEIWPRLNIHEPHQRSVARSVWNLGDTLICIILF